MKTCTKCNTEQPLAAYPLSGGKGQLSTWCRGCHAEYNAKRAASTAQAQIKDNQNTNWINVLKEAKEKKGISSAEIARVLAVAEENVRLWFTGGEAQKYPRQKHLIALFKVLEVPLPLSLTPNKESRLPITVSDCLSCGNPFPVYKKGVTRCSRACAGVSLSDRQQGVANARWRGGETVTKPNGGYVKQLAHEHDAADASGYVLQHRLVMEEKIGRKLLPNERVHHKNGVRDDNRPKNLELWLVKGNSKKDPAGQRQSDLKEQFLSLFDESERAIIGDKFREIYKV